MNYLDYIILVIVIVGFILGFKDGLVRKIIGLIGLIVAIVLAFQLGGKVGKLFTSFFNQDDYLASLISGIIIFLGVLLITSIVKRIIHPTDKVNNLINQTLGGLIGVIQILYFTSTICLFLNIFAYPKTGDREDSTFYNSVLNLIPKTTDFIIGNRSKAAEVIKEYIEKDDADTTTQIDSSKIK
ncbi:MAG: CvpA family protein [Ignavibacteriales bacterium]|nr:CvpA family protein [Ignavibacteriales bacterium]